MVAHRAIREMRRRPELFGKHMSQVRLTVIELVGVEQTIERSKK